MVTTVKVPPDGGYGWVIVLANALSNVIILPLMQSFGLIFKETFLEMGLSNTEGGLIINLNAGFGMIMGLLNGILLKRFGYRKVAMLASCLISVGIVLTSYASTFTQFIITYGIITSFGMGMNLSAYSFALNNYFNEKRGTAVAYAMTITGLGPIVMPQVINLLINIYTTHQVTMILGAIAANSFVAASLLQPIKWHLKTVEVKDEEEENAVPPLVRSISQLRPNRQISVLSQHSIETDDPVYGIDRPFVGAFSRSTSVVSQSWKNQSATSLTEDARSSVYSPELSKPIEEKSFCRNVLDQLVQFLDLDLLRDPIYVNIMVGMSLAIFAEINFSLLTAFILGDFGLDTGEIATFLSVMAVSDIIFRFLAPFVSRLLKTTPRRSYSLTLFLLIFTRFSLLISTNFYMLMGVALFLGVAKGLRTVFMALVIPSYVPIERLPSAAGIQMMVNGLCILIGGPVIGFIRDVTGSYTLCIIILNSITFSTIVFWGIEGTIVRLKQKKEKPVETGEQMSTLLNKA